MDGSQYHSNGLNNNNGYSLPGVSPHDLQQGPPHTLPPLQPQPQHQHQQPMMYGSAPTTPRTPATPNTPQSASALGAFPAHMGGQSRNNYQMMSNNYQQPPSQAYRASGPLMPPSSTAMSHPQPIAPAPSQGGRAPQALRPMPPNGLQMSGGMQSPYSHMMPQPSMMDNMEPPTHVVGSQGRRGILPSAPGRPAVPATGPGSAKNTMIPAKDADGKFPCPHCTKTYLHAKHLKRHLLRHTGDRPYMCVLCRDTFSRSDILKRHFQKCSIRRGNPTGASHLSHAQAHLKKSHPGPHKSSASMSNESDIMGVNGLSSLNDPSMHPFGVIPDGSIPDAASNMTDEQASQQLSRSNSLKRYSADGGQDRRSMAGVPGSSRGSFDQNSYSIASTMPSGMNPSLAFSMPNGQNGHSYSQNYNYANNGSNLQPQSVADLQPLTHTRTIPVYPSMNTNNHGLDWPNVYQPPPHNNFINPYSNSNVSNSQVTIKSEPGTNNGLFTGIYPGSSPNIHPSDFPNWNFQDDPLQQISSRLIALCFAPTNQISSRSNEMRKYLTPDNIKHFLEHFSSFQGHFPIIHVPSFRITEAYDGLLLGMICIGAVYSDRITPAQVRDLMDIAKLVVESNSQVYVKITREYNRDIGYSNESIGTRWSELEEITAIFMMHILSTWHGNPFQRENARRQFPLIVALARKAGLTQPVTVAPYSALHQPNVTVEHFNAANFDWNGWVEQEKRSRMMYAIFLLDAARVVYFNIEPSFETFEIKLPLPADDAAWDAGSSTECAEALGLHGLVAARDRNPEGSRRQKQPEMHTALRALLHSVYDLQPGTTNLYSKFILVHALHIQLWIAQRQNAQEPDHATHQSWAMPGSGTSTPMSQNDWVNRVAESTNSGASSNNNSGRATPINPGAQSPTMQQHLKATNNAFDKWKKAWDEDMISQYPPTANNYRRFGFCRDGVHFYWLAKYLMQNPRGLGSNMAPDQRFSRVMHLLKLVKGWVVSDSQNRGEELGSVSDIDKDYGVTDLTLDMAQLFKPLNKKIDSPVAGVHTNLGNGGLL